MSWFGSSNSAIDALEKYLSSYAQPVVDTVKDIASHPIESAKTAIPAALSFVQEHPYVSAAAVIGSFTLYKIYRNKGFGLSLGRVWGGVDTILGGASFDVHLGRYDDLHRRTLEAVRGVRGVVDGTQNTVNNTAWRVNAVQTQTGELHEEMVQRRRALTK